MPLKRVPLASVVFAAIGLFVLFWLTNASSLRAQSSHADWEKAAGGKMSFDVSSVRLNTSGSNAANTNFPWTMGTEVPQTGGLFVATNWPLYQYIFFAYKPTSAQQTALLNALPKWTKTDHFDVQARANGDPTADQYRMMMQSLLAERFKLAMHIETHDTPVFALVLAKPGKFGPQLRLHVDNPPCADAPIGSSAGMPLITGDGFPKVCGRVGPLPPKTPGRVAGWGGRNVMLADFAASLGYSAISQLGRPLIDDTGIAGNVDLFVEWTPPMPPSANVTPEMQDAPGLADALNQQLGLKLQPTNAPLESMVVDYIEEASPN